MDSPVSGKAQAPAYVDPLYTPPENPLRRDHTGAAFPVIGPVSTPHTAQFRRNDGSTPPNTSAITSNDAATAAGDGKSANSSQHASFVRSEAAKALSSLQSRPSQLERVSTETKVLAKRNSEESSCEEPGHGPQRQGESKEAAATSKRKEPLAATGTATMNASTSGPLSQTRKANASQNTQKHTSDFDIFRQNNFDRGDEEEEEEAVSVDSYGLPRYFMRYPNNTGRVGKPPNFEHATDDLSVPWYLRKPGGDPCRCTFFDFLRQQQFWRLFEFATRITAIAVLLPSALIAARLKNNPFVSPFAVISATILASKGNVGEAVAYLFVWIRAGCFWLPLAVIAGAIGLGDHIAGWCVYYTAILFIMAVFTEAMPRRICLLLFNSCLVGLLTDPSRGVVYVCRVMVDWCIGTGLCLVAAFFPYPIFCKTEAQHVLTEMSKNTATAFRGLMYSFWSPTNVERNMAMSKVRIMTESLDGLMPAFEHSQAFSFFEFLFESAEVREMRQLKFHFFERLRVNLSSMTRVLDRVEATPNAIDASDRSQAFGQLLTPHLNNVAEAFDELMDLLVAAKTKKAVLSLDEHFDNLRHHTEDMQEAYRLARRMLFYEHASDILEEFVPLMTFYLFTVVCFRDTVEVFRMRTKAFKVSTATTFKGILKKTAWEPFMDNVNFVKKLFQEWNRRELQRVIEAAKVSAAMILTIGFSYLINVDSASFSGPNIIAFVSGMNPVEALQASVVRLTGCLIGTVLGFFAGTYSKTPVQRVASLCTLMFVGTFLRTDKEYGIMSVYAMFVLVPLDSILETTIEDTVSRMNQNTFGIFIYLFVSILILPLSPSLILRAKRANVLRRMSACLSNMMWLFSIPPVTEFGNRSFSFRNVRQFGLLMNEAHGGDGGDADDVELPSPSQVAGKVSNRSIHMVMRTDTPMEELNIQLDDIVKRLKGTKEFMGFAKDERGLVTVDYPAKACNATYLHMYRMTFLLKTMWLSWNVMRSQIRYTKETKEMLRNLQPVARDVASAFDKIAELMTYMMKDPSVNLEGELMKAELDLISSSTELHTRKSKIMLMLINESVAEYRRDGGAGLDREPAFPPADLDGDHASDPAIAEDEVFHESATPSAPAQPHRHAQRRAHSPVTRNFNGRCHEGQHLDTNLADRHFSPTGSHNHSGSSRAIPLDGGLNEFPGNGAAGRTPAGSPTLQRSPHYGVNLRMVASERNVSVMPYLHRTTVTPTDASEGPIRLPANFRFPVSSEDAEGLHSFTLCLEMFANETKMLVMSLSVMIDHLRSKL